MKEKSEDTEMLMRYLLGTLQEEEQLLIEKKIFSDDAFSEELEALEDELRYDYAQGSLSGQERELYEKRYLITPQDREKIRLSAEILAQASSLTARRRLATKSETVSRWQRWTSAFPGVAIVRYAAAALTVAIVLGGSGLVVEIVQLRGHLADMQAQLAVQQQRLVQEASQERTRAGLLAADLQEERSRRARLEQEMAQRRQIAVSLILTPGLVRGEKSEQRRLRLAEDTDTLMLQLVLRPGAGYRRYRVTLRTADGDEVWSQDDLPPGFPATGAAVMVSLPARILKSQDYEVLLKGLTASGTFEDASDYYFTVVRR